MFALMVGERKGRAAVGWVSLTRNPTLSCNTISKKLGYSLSPQPSSLKLRLERGALVDQCVAPVDRNGIT
jgi:hypothetical protein